MSDPELVKKIQASIQEFGGQVHPGTYQPELLALFRETMEALTTKQGVTVEQYAALCKGLELDPAVAGTVNPAQMEAIGAAIAEQAKRAKQDGVTISSWAATEATEALKVMQADRYHMCSEYGEALSEILAALQQQEQSE